MRGGTGEKRAGAEPAGSACINVFGYVDVFRPPPPSHFTCINVFECVDVTPGLLLRPVLNSAGVTKTLLFL